ncbi:MAG: ParB/RepB/Spo0J family partition protein, partial [Oscillospiraceae bacterium]|nr:ParB/RepB/Spo0J family partition protein [Oscillospiraceae bacterium]
MYEENTRCPLQSECDKKCIYQHHERDCQFYRGNSRPGMELPDQEAAIRDEYEAAMSAANILSAPATTNQSKTDNAKAETSHLVLLPVTRLHPHPDNPRKDVGDIQELSDSIKANGIFQNLTVVPDNPTSSYTTFTVIIGHRRLAAAKLAGLTEVPCVVTMMTEKEQIQTMLMENMQRTDLTVYEQAQGFQMMLDLGSTVEEISEKSGFSKTTVRRRVKMMELDQDVLKQVSERQISITDIDKLAQIEDIVARNQCLAEIGTSQFDQSVTAQLRRQAIKRNLPIIKKMLKDAKAKSLEQNECWSGKYDNIGSYA